MPSLRASVAGLEQIKQTRKAKHWAIEDKQWLIVASQILDSTTDWASSDYASKQIFAPGISLSTWKRFLRGEAVQARVFKAFCQVLNLDWQRVVVTETHELDSDHIVEKLLPQSDHCDWGEAPDVSVFFGRESELSTLKQWILDHHCRLVAVVGLGGIGKTDLSIRFGTGGMGKSSLTAKVAQQLLESRGAGERESGRMDNFPSTPPPLYPFTHIIWRSLLNATPLTTLLVDLITILSNQQEVTLPNSPEACLARLLHYLRSQRCLLILDNVETILRGGDFPGHYREGYEGYGQLFKQVGEVSHQSCLVLTSREKPKEVAFLEGHNRPVRSLELGGLDLLSSQQIFAEISDFSGSEADWQALTALYNGNPLALELAAKHIDDVFGGNIAAFLQQGNPILHDLRELLDWYLQRLTEAELEMIGWLVIHREPLSVSELSEYVLSPIAKEQIPTTLQSLQRRLALKRSRDRFALHPVLIEYFTQYLIQQIADEIQTGQLYFFKSHALLLASAQDFVRDLQTRLILAPLANQLLVKLGEPTQVEAHLYQLLTPLRGKPIAQVGYAVGNILNLLCYLQADLSDRDFSNLAIAQAHLADTTLHRTNFAGANFVQSVFAELMSEIVSIAFNSTGEYMATAESDGILRLWHVATGHTLTRWQAHVNWINAVAFSPDDRWLASGGTDYRIHLWDARTGTCQKTLVGHTHWIKAIAFSSESQYLFSSSDDRTVRVWNVLTGECIHVLPGHTAPIWALAVHPHKTILASGSDDQTIRLWNPHTEECLLVLKGHTHCIRRVSFNPDGQTLVSVSDDATIRVWDVNTGACLQVIHSELSRTVAGAFDPSGMIFATGGYDRLLRFWEIRTGQCLRTLAGHWNEIRAIAFSPDSKICATGSADQTIRLWNVQTGQMLRTLKGYWDGVIAIACVPHRHHLLSGHFDGSIRLWNLETNQSIKSLKGHNNRVWTIAVSADGKLVASGSSDCTIRLWDLETNRCLRIIEGFNNWVWSVAFSPNQQLLASGSADNTVKLWDVATGTCLYTLSGHQGRVWTLAFSPDGRVLVSAAHDSSVKLWDVTTGQCLTTLPQSIQPTWTVQFSPDGTRLACGSPDHTVSLWDAHTQECLHVLRGHTEQTLQVSFSPDSQWLASTSYDQTIRVWNVSTGDCLHVLTGHTNVVSPVVFSMDGQAIISGSFDGTIRVWSFQSGECLRTLRAPRPYEEMNIAGVSGLLDTTQKTLELLGAIMLPMQS